MNLHEDATAFNELAAIASQTIGIPTSAVKRDYFMVIMLQKLAKSPYAKNTVFKGGTSLSKCYPGSIRRFSEDIDLTYIPEGDESDKHIARSLENIESIMSSEAYLEKIPQERNKRNKSAFVLFGNTSPTQDRIKLEIGSRVRPEPYSIMSLKTYIHDFLTNTHQVEVIKQYELESVSINTLRIERTFLDKVMAVKRHAICGTLPAKVRHIYDVAVLYPRKDIQRFLEDGDNLKHLLRLVKETDTFYLQKRNISDEYNPDTAYNFETWRNRLDNKIRSRYEKLHEELLYTDEKQSLNAAIKVFEALNALFKSIGE